MKYLLFILIAITFNSVATSQIKPIEEVSLDNLITETQLSKDANDEIEIVWWLPTVYWETVFSQDPMTSKEESEEIIGLLKNYILIIVIKGKVGMFGGVTYEDRSKIEEVFSVAYNDSDLDIVAEESLSPDLKNFISLIQPIMKNMIGPMGENMQIFIFENKKRGETVIDSKQKGTMSFKLGDFESNLDLPLESLLLEKMCPKDKKLMSGKWNYCPIHGSKLISQ